MKRKLIIFLFFKTICQGIMAQPGGGGGLCILNIYDYSGIVFLKGDTALKIQLFALSENGNKQKFQIKPNEEDIWHSYYYKSKTYIYLPPFVNDQRDKYIPNQRLLLIYNKDTMTIDFIDVMSENESGLSDVVTNIYFNSGYYKSYRNPGKKGEGSPVDKENIRKALANGINTNTDHILVSWGMLVHIPDPNRENKSLWRSRKSCRPEMVLKPYYRICENQILLHDSTVDLQTEIPPATTGDTNVMYYQYYFSFDYRSSYTLLQEVKLATDKLDAFRSFRMTLNGKNYTGLLKLAVPFYNAGESSTYSGCDLWIIRYSEGKIIGFKQLTDVNIINETPLKRLD